MSAVDQYAARIDAVAAQRTRIFGAESEARDRWSGASARRFRADPRRPLDDTLTFIAAYLEPGDVFVDVGGGAGRVGLPLSYRVREVIDVDPSPGMKVEFDDAVEEAGITNARYVESDWLDAAGIKGDVTFASHVTYFVRDIRGFIEKMHAAAARRVMLLIGSVPPPAMNGGIFNVVFGEEQVAVPGHTELLPVLWELGLLPEVRLLPGPFIVGGELPQTREQALQAGVLAVGDSVDNERVRTTVDAHFDELFAATPQGFVARWRPAARALLITWETGA